MNRDNTLLTMKIEDFKKAIENEKKAVAMAERWESFENRTRIERFKANKENFVDGLNLSARK